MKNITIRKSIRFLKSYSGGFFYLLAGIYIMLTKSPDLISITSIISCFAFAVLSITKYKDWSAIGGGMLIAGSLFMQAILSYRCVDCIRADIFIFIGMIILVLTERGRHKKLLRVMGLTAALFLTFNIAAHYSPKAIIGLSTVTVVDEVQDGDCPYEDKIEVVSKENKTITLEIGNKPIVLFSPSCGACVEAVEKLVKADPKGEKWIAVQAYGDSKEGEKLLKENGFSGESYVFANDWSESVPTMLAKNKEGKTISVSGQKQMLNIIKGEVN